MGPHKGREKLYKGGIRTHVFGFWSPTSLLGFSENALEIRLLSVFYTLVVISHILLFKLCIYFTRNIFNIPFPFIFCKQATEGQHERLSVGIILRWFDIHLCSRKYYDMTREETEGKQISGYQEDQKMTGCEELSLRARNNTRNF